MLLRSLNHNFLPIHDINTALQILDISDASATKVIYSACMHTRHIDFYILDISGVFYGFNVGIFEENPSEWSLFI